MLTFFSISRWISIPSLKKLFTSITYSSQPSNLCTFFYLFFSKLPKTFHGQEPKWKGICRCVNLVKNVFCEKRMSAINRTTYKLLEMIQNYEILAVDFCFRLSFFWKIDFCLMFFPCCCFFFEIEKYCSKNICSMQTWSFMSEVQAMSQNICFAF